MKNIIKRNKMEDMIFQWAEPKVLELGADLVDVHYRRENNKLFLRLFIDRRGGVDMESCVRVNETIDQLIDAELELNHDYFEVSSAGLDRSLITLSDFERHMDEMVDVYLYQKMDNKKQLTGRLKSVSQMGITLGLDRDLDLSFAEIAKVKLHIEF